MGYLFVLVAVLSGTIKGYCGKKTSSYTSNYKDAIFINMIRMVLCIVIGLAVLGFQGNLSALQIDRASLLITIFSGITTTIFVVCWLISVKTGAYMMLDVFLMVGVMVTLGLSFFVFGEPIRPNQGFGIALLFISIIMMCSYNSKLKGKMSISSFLILFICGIANGLTDFSQKLYIMNVENYNISVFNFYTYLFSALALFIFLLTFHVKNEEKGKSHSVHTLKDIFPYVLVMSLCLFINSFFKTKGATYLTSLQLYPLNQGLSLIFSTLMSVFLFKEKLTQKGALGLVLAFTALIIINT